jgi:hypothetical protein
MLGRMGEFEVAPLQCRQVGGDVPRQNILAWLPFVAAARLTEDVPGELDRLLATLRSS